jgi:hypothetical protein
VFSGLIALLPDISNLSSPDSWYTMLVLLEIGMHFRKRENSNSQMFPWPSVSFLEEAGRRG